MPYRRRRRDCRIVTYGRLGLIRQLLAAAVLVAASLGLGGGSDGHESMVAVLVRTETSRYRPEPSSAFPQQGRPTEAPPMKVDFQPDAAIKADRPLALVRAAGVGAFANPGAHIRSSQGNVQSIIIHDLAADGAPTPEPTPVPVPTPEPDATVYAQSIPDIICSEPWPCSTALAVAQCESGLDPNAYNPVSGASGLYQLLMSYHAWRLHGASPFDPQANTDAAYSLYEEQGWGPWQSSRGCWG